MSTIIVQMGEASWTEEALHLACAMARNTGTGMSVTLLRLIPVQHYGWLGTSLGDKPLSPQDYEQLCEYESTAGSYGVDLILRSMQCISVREAIMTTVEPLGAKTLFAPIAPHSISLWRKYQTWDLQRQLARRGCALYTLDQSVQIVAPAEFSVLNQHG